MASKFVDVKLKAGNSASFLLSVKAVKFTENAQTKSCVSPFLSWHLGELVGNVTQDCPGWKFNLTLTSHKTARSCTNGAICRGKQAKIYPQENTVDRTNCGLWPAAVLPTKGKSSAGRSKETPSVELFRDVTVTTCACA